MIKYPHQQPIKYMNYTTTIMRLRIAISSLSLASLLIGSLIGDTMVHQALAQTINNSSSYTSTNSTQNAGPPHKVIIPFYSQQPTILSDVKKNPPHPHSRPLPSSGEPIHSPLPGTQTSMNKMYRTNSFITISYERDFIIPERNTSRSNITDTRSHPYLSSRDLIS